MIKVVQAGIYNTVQDKGRFGFAKMGVPNAGAMDSYSADLGNALLHNDDDDAVVEITFGQGKFQFTEPTFFCLTGGDFSPKLDTAPLEINTIHKAEPNSVLSFGKRKYGARTYIAVKGGIRSDEVLESRSSSKGITKIRLEKGDELVVKATSEFDLNISSKVKINQEHFTSDELECFPGPEFDLLNEKQKGKLFESFTISEDNNRVGYRLNEVVTNNLPSILTSAVLPGTVQLTPSGKLIVLMKDCQVTGGYPRVLQLSKYAISRLSQKIAGEKIRFVK